MFGTFQRTDRRPALFAKLREFVSEVRAVSPAIRIVLDGSFVMKGVDDPGDIDGILILPERWDWSAILRPFEYNVLNTQMVRRRHGFDLITVVEGSGPALRAISFFEQVNVKWLEVLGIPFGTTKGLVEVTP